MMRQEVQEVFDICRCMVVGQLDRIKWINYLLYYGNYMSIDKYSQPLFWCTYFNVNQLPYASPILAEVHPDYSEIAELQVQPNQRVLDVLSDCLDQMVQVFDSLGQDGLDAFIMGIGLLHGRPKVSCWDMLFYVNQPRDKKNRKIAQQQMREHYTSHNYTKTIINEDKEVDIECTKYVL